jgi:hypothetical protein
MADGGRSGMCWEHGTDATGWRHHQNVRIEGGIFASPAPAQACTNVPSAMQTRPTGQRAEHLHLVLGANGAGSALPAASMTAILGLPVQQHLGSSGGRDARAGHRAAPPDQQPAAGQQQRGDQRVQQLHPRERARASQPRTVAISPSTRAAKPPTIS